jgi:hypothetical protein
MQKGLRHGYEYVYIFNIVVDKKARKQLEKDVIKDFIKVNARKPIMNLINA